MAGMEQLEIHSKSYLVRWVNVKAGYTISWSIQPHGHKKAINFGIFKHPGAGNAPTPKLPSSTFEPPPTPGVRQADAIPDGHGSKNASSSATEKLKAIGLKPISWYGTCEPGRVSAGTYDVPEDEGGMYALVFDNTFAKQFSKNVTFVLLTYPTDSPPQQNHHIRHIQGPASSTSLRDNSASWKTPIQRDSSESVVQPGVRSSRQPNGTDVSRQQLSGQTESSLASNFFTGVLQKRRRKRHQGYARRFFSLDFTSSTLSYYHNRHTLALRGAIPLSLAAIGANATTRQISIDSGAEIWHLKAHNRRDFEAWKDALELASASLTPASPAAAVGLDGRGGRFSATRIDSEEERQWARVESLLKRVEDARDTARTIAKDTDPKYLPSSVYRSATDKADPNSQSVGSSTSGSPSEQSLNSGYFQAAERKPFWKRRQTNEKTMPGMFRRSVSATPTLSATSSAAPTPKTASFASENSHLERHAEESIHDHSMSLLKDLDSIVADFATLLAESKQRRSPRPPIVTAASRHSIDSQGTQEFFDASGGNDSQLLDIQDETDNEVGKSEGSADEADASSSASEIDDKQALHMSIASVDKSSSAFPTRPGSLAPLPGHWVKRRDTIPLPTVQPPSLIGFLRKNVGKDLSTMSMPVSANEPISLLQRASEQLEYSFLLDTAATISTSSNERLLYIAAFAVSSLSNSRVKERAIRKPFNPMLGETFELVREDRGFRFLAEKISHHPLRMACQGESEHWTFTQSPMPTQKFWGKSAEIVTEGRVRIILHSTGDRFSFAPATSFLRNIIAGEKYVEPVGNMNITNETTGESAIVTFKSKGMFSGRSEDVVVQTFDAYGDELPHGLIGKWTSALTITEHGIPKTEPIWKASELPPDAAKRYGFTTFAASLNEITPNEKGKMAPTDSRLRPDQRAVEDGDLDAAERLKHQLEEGQRKRKKALEDSRAVRKPKWFESVEVDTEEEVWKLKSGKDGYWDERGGKWEGLESLFEA